MHPCGGSRELVGAGLATELEWMSGAGTTCEYARWVCATADVDERQQHGARDEEHAAVEQRETQANGAPWKVQPPGAEDDQSSADTHSRSQIR